MFFSSLNFIQKKRIILERKKVKFLMPKVPENSAFFD